MRSGRRTILSLLVVPCLVLAACSDSNIGTNNSPPEANIELPAVGTEVIEGATPTNLDDHVVKILASSAVANVGSYTFQPSNLHDGALDTCWQEANKESDGPGEWVTVYFAQPVDLTKVRIANGCQLHSKKYGDLFTKNSRPSRLLMTSDAGGSIEARLADSTSWQSISVDLKEVSELTLQLQSVYRGESWQDASLSELSFTGTPKPMVPENHGKSRAAFVDAAVNSFGNRERLAAMKKVYGEPKRVSTEILKSDFGGTNRWVTAEFSDHKVRFLDDPDKTFITRVVVTGEKVSLLYGIKVGVSADKVLETFGTPERFPAFETSPGGWRYGYQSELREQSLYFVFENGRVKAIYIGPLHEFSGIHPLDPFFP